MGEQEHSKRHNDFFRQLLFLAVLVVVGVVIFDQLKFFVGSFLGAFTLYVVFRGPLFWIKERWRWKSWAAALFMVIVTIVLMLGAGFFIFKLLATEIPNIDATAIMGKFDKVVAQFNHIVSFDIVPDNIGEIAGKFVTSALSAIVNTTYNFAANLFMMIVILYFMFAAGRRMEHFIYRYSPFRGENLGLLKSEIKNMVFSNAIGIPLILIAQMLAAALIYKILGVNQVFFWAFLTGFSGLIPLVGTALIYVPMAIIMAVNGEPWSAVIVVAYGAAILSNIDNVIRIVVMGKYADTHPLIVIFGVILGIPMFGFFGIIFGPLLISGFMLLVKIYYVEYGLLNTSEQVEVMIESSQESSHPEVNTRGTDKDDRSSFQFLKKLFTKKSSKENTDKE